MRLYFAPASRPLPSLTLLRNLLAYVTDTFKVSVTSAVTWVVTSVVTSAALFTLLFGTTTDATAQVYNGNLSVSRQTQIDSIALYLQENNLPNIEVVTGYLYIGISPSVFNDTVVSNITDISLFSSLRKVYGDIYIRRTKLTNLNALQSLDTLDGEFFTLEGNDSLLNLNGLQGVTKWAESFWISDNDRLTDLTGLENIHETTGILIEKNDSLQTLQGLNNLERAGEFGIVLRDNDELQNLSGLSALKSTDRLGFSGGNSLVTTEGLTNLDTIGGITPSSGHGIYFSECPSLASLNGLQTVKIRSKSAINIFNNDALTTLDGLYPDEDRIGITITDNDNLLNTDAFSKVRGMPWGQYNISYNALLESISIDSLRFAGAFTVRNNPSLTHFGPAPYLDSIIEETYICYNTSLTDLGGLVNTKIGGDLTIANNDSLKNITGFNRIKSTWGKIIIGNHRDLAINGFDSLWNLTYLIDTLGNNQPKIGTISIGGRVLNGFSRLQHAPAISLMYFDSISENSFAALYHVGVIQIIGGANSGCKLSRLPDFLLIDSTDNPPQINNSRPGLYFGISSLDSLKSIDNIQHLTFYHFGMGNCNNIDSLPTFKMFQGEWDEWPEYGFSHNAKQLDLSCLDSITKYQDLYIDGLNIQNLDGIRQAQTVYGSLSIINNPNLTDCSPLCILLPYLTSWVSIDISGNAMPCNLDQPLNHYCDTLTVVDVIPAQPENFKLLAYPNPATDVINVALPMPSVGQLAVYDALGKPVYQVNLQQNTPSVAVSAVGWPIGLYFVVFRSDAQIHSTKVVLTH